jgi:predicted phage terminase large subunit-like protein
MWIGIESVAYQLSFVQQAVRAGLPAEPIMREKGHHKAARVIPLATAMANGKVFFRAGAPWLDDLEEELLAFPGGGHDDMVDAAADAARELAIGSLSPPSGRERGRRTHIYVPFPDRGLPFKGRGPVF